jgi:glycosyltransferase involved in cell wall biosynthesis
MQDNKFSLVMATLGRSDEIVIFLESLRSQTYKNFELILVDQNDDNRVYDLYIKYKDRIDIHYCRSGKKGLSLNRNTGLAYVSGGITAFPDDDCEYEKDTLEKAAVFFDANPGYGFYTCNTKEKNGRGAVLEAEKQDCDITIYNLMRTGISFTIFTRTGALGNFRFDEQLGVGAEYGSGEESDLLLFLIKNKQRGRYHSRNFIYHPEKSDIPERVYSYSRGFGALYKKAVQVYRFYPLLLVFLYRISRTIIKLIFFKNKSASAALIKGRFDGFIGYKVPEKLSR